MPDTTLLHVIESFKLHNPYNNSRRLVLLYPSFANEKTKTARLRNILKVTLVPSDRQKADC